MFIKNKCVRAFLLGKFRAVKCIIGIFLLCLRSGAENQKS